jgi:hypothetical protein
MTVTYLRWRDASFDAGECDEANMGLSDLQEVGWLVREDDESVTLAMEHQEESKSRRLWLTVPKVNIAERRDAELERAFPVRKRKR